MNKAECAALLRMLDRRTWLRVYRAQREADGWNQLRFVMIQAARFADRAVRVRA